MLPFILPRSKESPVYSRSHPRILKALSKMSMHDTSFCWCELFCILFYTVGMHQTYSSTWQILERKRCKRNKNVLDSSCQTVHAASVRKLLVTAKRSQRQAWVTWVHCFRGWLKGRGRQGCSLMAVRKERPRARHIPLKDKPEWPTSSKEAPVVRVPSSPIECICWRSHWLLGQRPHGPLISQGAVYHLGIKSSTHKPLGKG